MQVAGLATGVVMAAVEADGKTAVLIRPPLRAAPLGRIVRVAMPGRSAPMGCLHSAPVGYSTRCLRAPYRRYVCLAPCRRLVWASTSASFLRSAAIDYNTNGYRTSLHRPARASEGSNNTRSPNTPKESTPSGPKSYWDHILSALKSDVFKLSLLGVAVVIGYCAAMKGNKMAEDIVSVCDKTHKIYNIMSKALPLILAFFKG